jgi:hypothetical protein
MFTRRVRWFATEDDSDIRLEFIEEFEFRGEEFNGFYRDPQSARIDWDRFRAGVTPQELRKERTTSRSKDKAA